MLINWHPVYHSHESGIMQFLEVTMYLFTPIFFKICHDSLFALFDYSSESPWRLIRISTEVYEE